MIDVAEMYTLLAESGLDYGESFQGLREAWRVVSEFSLLLCGSTTIVSNYLDS